MYIQNQNRNSKGKTKLAATIIALVIIVIGGIQWLAPHFLPSLFTMIARPFWRMEFSIQEGALRSPEALLAENADLHRQVDDLNTRFLITSLLEQENSDLKAVLGRSTTATTSTSTQNIPTKKTKNILAAVLRRPPLSPYDEIIIDIGTDHGLVVGQLVYAPGNVLIGKVADVLSDTSKVQLLSSPNSTFDIKIGSTSASATAHGKGGGQYSAELPRDVVVASGDVVLAPGFSMTPIGTVGAVITDPTQPFETIIFAPPVGVYGMKWVLVDVHASSSIQ